MYRALVTVGLVALALLAPARSLAQGVPIIVAGREAEILNLLEPFRNGKELAPGWSVASVDVPVSRIHFALTGPAGARAVLTLLHPSESRSAERTASFVLEQSGPDVAAARAALDRLASAVRMNDRGGFWPSEPPAAVRPPPSAVAPDAAGRSPIPTTDPASMEPFRKRALDSAWGVLPERRGVVPGLMPFLLDGVVLAAAACILLLLHLRRALTDAPRWVPVALAGLVLTGGLLRWAMAPETVMNAWPYTRVPPLVRLVLTGGVARAVSRAFDLRYYLTDAVHHVDMLVATVTPVAFFAHARHALGDWKAALFASALLVLLPLHIHFSRSDVEYVQSLATSSITFTALYTALRDPSRAARWMALLVLPPLSYATYHVRPENLFFAGVEVGAVLLTAGRDVPLRRRLLVLSVVLSVAVHSLFTHLLVVRGAEVRQGLDVATLRSAGKLLFDTRRNTLVNPWITPPLVGLLALLGASALFRRGEWRRGVYFLSWLVGFFVVHSFVVPKEPAMMARYHMHLVTPLLMLAGSAFPVVTSWRRWVQGGGAALLVASPLFHRSFIRASDFDIMREYDLLRAGRERIPDGCTVLELVPMDSLSDAEITGDSRMLRHGAQLADGEFVNRWNVVGAAMPPAPRDGKPGPHEVLSREAEAVLAHPPSCLVFLEGMTCRTHRPPGTSRAPVCDEVLRRMPSEPLFGATFPVRIYDERNAGRRPTADENEASPPGLVGMLRPGEPMSVVVHRWRAP